ncbi:MAG: hypothetical protein HN368_19545 [Spirochaetales bacterium]|jgi:hypothetical protein|nr:hypothetical protein [Spirochaetales bacterium]
MAYQTSIDISGDKSATLRFRRSPFDAYGITRIGIVSVSGLVVAAVLLIIVTGIRFGEISRFAAIDLILIIALCLAAASLILLRAHRRGKGHVKFDLKNRSIESSKAPSQFAWGEVVTFPKTGVLALSSKIAFGRPNTSQAHISNSHFRIDFFPSEDDSRYFLKSIAAEVMSATAGVKESFSKGVATRKVIENSFGEIQLIAAASDRGSVRTLVEALSRLFDIPILDLSSDEPEVRLSADLEIPFHKRIREAGAIPGTPVRRTIGALVTRDDAQCLRFVALSRLAPLLVGAVPAVAFLWLVLWLIRLDAVASNGSASLSPLLLILVGIAFGVPLAVTILYWVLNLLTIQLLSVTKQGIALQHRLFGILKIWPDTHMPWVEIEQIAIAGFFGTLVFLGDQRTVVFRLESERASRSVRFEITRWARENISG